MRFTRLVRLAAAAGILLLAGIISPALRLPAQAQGDPIFNPSPGSTLLPPGTTTLDLSVETSANAACVYSLDDPTNPPVAFEQGDGTTQHAARLTGLNPDPNTVNEVYVVCDSDPSYTLHLRYRSLAAVNPSFPRTGNLWGWWGFIPKGLPYMARIDLWLGANDMEPDQIRELRRLNPDVLVLTSINAIEPSMDMPEEYYLHGTDGRRVEVWPGSYRLNLTKPEVAEFQARLAYQLILASDLMYDGCFFDNVFLSQSWQTQDIFGAPFEIDADEDGQPDDPAAFDTAWRAGVLHEIATFRALMPYAIISGHALDIYTPEIAAAFNGISIGFDTANVIEGRISFGEAWEKYTAWYQFARPPQINMVESAIPNQIAYGYDYEPISHMPASTLEFARTYYPYVRFGLAYTLMQDGYFAHEIGDTWHGNDWWYDELNFDLGYPVGPAEALPLPGAAEPAWLPNGDFEDAIGDSWNLWADTDTDYQAAVTQDTSTAVSGSASARIDISASAGENWRVEFASYDNALTAGTAYNFSFWAKSDAPRTLYVSSQKGSPDWRNYGLWREIPIDTVWRQYVIPFVALETVNDARAQFLVGDQTGTVWIDAVQLGERPPDVLRREFTNGLVLLNATTASQTVEVGPGWQRLTGTEAALYQYRVDNDGAGFSADGVWTAVTYDSGEWKAAGPFYHDWGATCLQGTGAATWDLMIPAADVYTIEAWWPAAPTASDWSANAVFEIVSGGQVIASATFDQRSGGDEWHLVGQVALEPGAQVRLVCAGDAPCIADALHVRSQARFNDGSPAASVTLQPMDGIILQRAAGQ